MSLDLRSLIGRLSDTSRRALEGAAGICLSRTHYEVEMEHWFAKLLEESAGDLPKILQHFDVGPDRFLADLNRALDDLRQVLLEDLEIHVAEVAVRVDEAAP